MKPSTFYKEGNIFFSETINYWLWSYLWQNLLIIFCFLGVKHNFDNPFLCFCNCFVSIMFRFYLIVWQFERMWPWMYMYIYQHYSRLMNDAADLFRNVLIVASNSPFQQFICCSKNQNLVLKTTKIVISLSILK